ncbi:type VI immunity family protein [Stigmatella erecta]|uniref:type VI immunity family protein n=1 Tax=Stigmatella erecta TaxID=83460 RepID=UPI0015A732FC
MRNLALELAAPLPFCSGQAGLSFHAMHGCPETEETLSQLCLRYPGMDVLSLRTLSWKLGTRVKGPAWLTFLGQPVLRELGGADGLRARLSSPSTTIQRLEKERAIVTLCTWPEAGNTGMGHHLPGYREFARVRESRSVPR